MSGEKEKIKQVTKMKAVTGTLITCEPSIGQILFALDETLHFIIQQLDDRHFFIDSSFVSLVHQRLDQILEENTYRADCD